jgi:hypothetical protein
MKVEFFQVFCFELDITHRQFVFHFHKLKMATACPTSESLLVKLSDFIPWFAGAEKMNSKG